MAAYLWKNPSSASNGSATTALSEPKAKANEKKLAPAPWEIDEPEILPSKSSRARVDAASASATTTIAVTAKSDGPKLSLIESLRLAKSKLDEARPTAVNLSWATARMVAYAESYIEEHKQEKLDESALVDLLLQEAQRIADEDVETNSMMAKYGAQVVPKNANILHHCNTGRLATVDIGTALGVVYECHKEGKNVHVWFVFFVFLS